MNTEQSIIDYWDREWVERKADLQEQEILCNGEKAKYLLSLIWGRAHFFPLRKLEIGCGTCFHAKIISNISHEWTDKYLGIDVSPEAVKIAKSWGINAQVGDIYTFDTDRKIELFLFLDVLEHLQNHKAVCEKIVELAADRFWIFANVPLYNSEHFQAEGAYERDINIGHVKRFMKRCGIPKFTHKVYGIDGWPYMWFEGTNQ